MSIVIFSSNIILFKLVHNEIRKNLQSKNITLITKNKLFLEDFNKDDSSLIIKLCNDNKQIKDSIKNLNRECRILSFASGYIFSKEDINQFNFPILNFHTGLIPENRGRTPLFWDIIEEKKYSYATLHAISPIIDMGRIVDSVSVKVSNNDTPKTLAEKLFEVATSKNMFSNWLNCNKKKILSIKENKDTGNYKKSFDPEQNFVSSTYSKKYILKLWRCYSIWKRIQINNEIFVDISEVKKNSLYNKVITSDNQFIFCKKLEK